MNETIKITGQARAVVRDSEGNTLHDTGWEPNVTTNLGKAAMAGLVGNVGAVTAPSYIALGTSATTPTAADTTLGAEITDSGLQRVSVTPTRDSTGGQTNDTLVFTNNFTATGSKTVQEAGILNASSNGTLFVHKLFTSPISVVSTNTLAVTYKITFS